ncbi:MAG: hypothetical protein ACQER7_04630 [Bacteroidota bacterium]
MKSSWLIYLLIFWNLPDLFASNELVPIGARSSGMANASVMLPGFSSVFHNQAGLAFLESISVGFHHRSGFVKEMDRQAVAVLFPTPTGTLASSFSYYGYSHYQEIKAGLAYGKFLARNMAAGIQIDYFNTRITGIYGKADILTFEAGLMFKMMDHVYVGTHVFNPVRVGIGEAEEKIPTIFRLGVGYRFTEDMLVCVEGEKDLERAVMPRMGIEYQPLGQVFIRAGMSVNPVMNFFGLGYSWKSFHADVAFSYHQILGYMPEFSMNYAF